VHYYSHNIADYKSHTEHLEPLEDLAYRRMLDYCYLHEIGLPEDIEDIARLIRMRPHSDCIANVLREFFTLENGVYTQARVERELEKYREKSDKAKKSAEARWSKNKVSSDANALRTECEGNANQEPITNNHKPTTKNNGRMKRPTLEEVLEQFQCRVDNPKAEAERFFNYYESNGWKVGKNPMKSWKHAVTNWITRSSENGSSKSVPNRALSRADECREEIRNLFGSVEDNGSPDYGNN